MVLSPTTIIVVKNDRVWQRNSTANPRHREKETQRLLQFNIGLFQVPFPFNVNKMCSDKTNFALLFAQAYCPVVSKL